MESEVDELDVLRSIYFIEAHSINQKFILSLSNNLNIKAFDIELLKEKKFNLKNKNDFILKVYKFKYLINRNEYEISVHFKDEENGNELEGKITSKNMDSFKTDNYFLYDFLPLDKNNNNYLSLNLNEFPLNHQEQFQIFLDILKEENKKEEKSKEIIDLLKSIFQFFIKNESKYDFYFFLLVFIECFNTELINDFILSFLPEKINGLGKFNKEKIEEIREIINSVTRNPEAILKNIKTNEQSNAKFKLNVIILYFDLNFQKEKMISEFKGKNKLLNLILHNNKFFFQILDYNEIKEILSLSNDSFSLLNIIDYCSSSILKKFKEKKSKIIDIKKENIKDIFIQIDKNIESKEEDISKICFLIKNIINFEKVNEQYIFFSPEFFEKIIELADETNLEKLLILKSTIEDVKKYEKIRISTVKLVKLITKAEQIFLNKKNIDWFIIDSSYIKNHFKENDKYRDKLALYAIEINKLDENFFKEWKEKKWNNYLLKHDDNFIDKACYLAKDIERFKILYQILLEGKEKDQYKRDALIAIQNTFLNIYQKYNCEDLKKYINLISNIIYKSDYYNLKDNQLEKFVKILENNLNIEFIISLYINILNNFTNISEKLKLLIFNYLEKVNYEHIYKLIQDLTNEDSLQLFDKFSKYIINEKDFFTLEDTIPIKILKSLKIHNIFPSKDSSNKFLKDSYEKLMVIKDKFINKDYSFKSISIFFEKEYKKDFYDRIALFYINPNELMENCIKNNQPKIILISAEIEIFYEKINNYRNTLNLIYDYLSHFFSNFYSDHIKEIKKLIYCIENNKINQLNEEINLKIKFYEDKFGRVSKERIKIKESIIFNYIYKNEKKNNNENEEKNLANSIEKFFKTKEVFIENDFNYIKEDILNIYLKAFKNKNEEEIQDEILRLIIIFGIKDYNNNSIDNLIKNFILLFKKDKIIEVTKAIKIFIEEVGAIQEEYTETLNSIIELSSNLSQIDFVKMCIELLKALEIDIMNKDNSFYNILIKLSENKEVIKFLFSKSVDECDLLYDALDNNEFLKISDILSLEKCVEYINNIGSLTDIKYMKDYDLIKKANFLYNDYKGLESNLMDFIRNYNDIKEIIKQKFDKSETSKQKILNICKKSKFNLSNFKNNYFEGLYMNFDNKKININLNDLLELRDRAVMMINPLGDSNENQIYIDFVSDILKVYNLLNEIYYYGYFKTIEIEIILQKCSITFEFKSPDSLIKKLKENKIIKKVDLVLDKLMDILNNLKINYEKGYREKVFLRYIYGRQFNFIYKFFHEDKSINLIPILKLITNNEIKDYKIDYFWKNDLDEYKEIINNCNSFIEKILKDNNISLEKIYEKSIIKINSEIDNYEGFYVFSCIDVEKELIQLYKYLTGNIPISQNILLCNKKTTNEEITAFLFRAIYCEFHSCFVVGGIELLNFNQKNFFVELLNNILHQIKRKINSCLIIFSNDKNSDIYNSLNSIKYKKTFNSEIEDKIKGQLIDKLTKITIVSSDKSGVGKSTKIEKYIEKNNKNYIHFPIGGVFTREDIIQRLKKIDIKSNSAIHLDLYDTDNIDFLNEFLFWILLAKLYKVNEDIFYLLKDTEIYIEIPNGFINFFAKFPILTLIPQNKENKLSINYLEPLIVTKNVDSNEQIVANYLNLLKIDNIDNIDLYFPNITQEELKNDEIRENTFFDAQIMKQKDCQDLIFDAIKKENKKFSYYQVKSFIDILAIQFKKFNQSYYLNAAFLKNGNANIKKVRTFIIKNFINLSSYFTEGAFTQLINNQNFENSIIFRQYDENEDIKKGINYLSNDNHYIISFEKMKYSLIFFHEGNKQSFSIITNKKEKDPEYKSYLRLKNCQRTKNEQIINKLTDYQSENFEQKDFLRELKEILDIENPINGKESISSNKRLKSLEEITKNYVFTPDNFVKMILILLRIRSNIPVIMMGETGCGKTALIRKLAELKNNKMEILNIHAGTTDKDIINFIKNNIYIKAKDLEDIEKKEKRKKENLKLLYDEKKIWVFLDEINTCKSMGLITELLCKHSCQGEKLPSNIVFIAACNPYREIKNKKEIIGLEIKQANINNAKLNEKEKNIIKKTNLYGESQLVYKVNPLPHSLLNYVFDFGSLVEEDEKKYIENIIDPSIEKIFKQCRGVFEKEKIKIIKDFSINMIIIAQNFIRENNDISSVSLREIRRYVIFYEFYYRYLKNKKENLFELINNRIEKEIYEKITEFDYQIYAVNLSIFICYYLRISNKNIRKELLRKLNVKFKLIYKERDFLQLPEIEEQFIANNIIIEKGIAKNKPLLENIFALFCTINTKIPIFIVGKPGNCKSLSVQLIFKAMKGINSKNKLFNSLPKLIMFCYQGSLTSTSEGVKEIFNRARKALTKFEKEKNKNISMIYFDEMGLAEHSPNNPLKVIHSELEYDLNEENKRVAFVGISNWVLDAAKMNRGIQISIPELDEEDNINTSITIAESYSKKLKLYRNFFENLGKTYYKYKKFLKDKYSYHGKEDFHGNRDFFHLVKYCSSKLKDFNKKTLDDKNLYLIGIQGLKKNFSGLLIKGQDENESTSINIINNIYNKFYPNFNEYGRFDYDYLYYIKENLKENTKKINRYLLLISNSSVSFYLLSSILEDKNYNFLIGSKFKGDLNSEEYQLKIIKKVQLFMEQGKIIILKNLETVYPAFYDLFNQNFTIMNEKKYARLSIGSNFNLYSYVNENFKCIVSIDITNINKQEPPFLNRFEKHIISYENLLNDDLKYISKEINDIINRLISNAKDNLIINFDIQKIVINLGLEEIQGLVYETYKKLLNINKKNYIIQKILSKISLTLPQEIIIPLKYNKNFEYRKLIIKSYIDSEHSNLKNFLIKMEKNKNIIYTFSKILDVFKNILNIKNEKFKLEIKSFKEILIIKIRGIKSEKEFEQNIDEFFNDDSHKLCFIQFTAEESELINYIKFFIENKEKEYQNNKKIFIFIIHLERIFNFELKEMKLGNVKYKEKINKKTLKETISNISDYYQIFIDNLNGEEKYSIKEFLKAQTDKIFFDKFLNLNEYLVNKIYLAINYFKYNILFSINNLNKDNYIVELIKYIKKEEKIRNLIKKYINNIILKDDNIFFELIKKDIKKNNEEFRIKLNEYDIDMISKFIDYFSNLFISKLSLFIFKLEKMHVFPSLLILEQEKELLPDKKYKIKKNIIDKISLIIFENFLKDDNIIISEKVGSNIINIKLGLQIPGIKNSFKNIIQKVNEIIINNYRINELNYRNKKINNDDNYWKIIKRNCQSTSIEIKRDSLISKIIDQLKKKSEIILFFNCLIEDLYVFFIHNNVNISNNNITNFESIIKFLKLIIEKNNKIFEEIMYDEDDEGEKSEEDDFVEDDKMNEEDKSFEDYEENEEKKIKLKNLKKKKIGLIANIINWLECYKFEISNILKIYFLLEKKIDNLYQSIKELYENLKVLKKNEIANITETLSFSIHSILKILLSNKSFFNNIDDNNSKLIEIIDCYKEVLQDISQIKNNININSREFYSLKEIVEILNSYYINKVNNKKNCNNILKFFSKQAEYINNKKLNAKFDKFFGRLFKNIGKDKKFPKIINIILENEFKKIEIDDYQENLVKKMVSNESFKYESSNLIKLIFDKIIKYDFKNIENNFLNIKKNIKNNNIYEIINNNCNNSILEEVILSYFEAKISLYFNLIPKIEEKELKMNFPKYYNIKIKDKSDCGILLDQPLILFQKEVNNLNTCFDKQKNLCLCKLYSIAFIKIYLNKVAFFIKKSNQELSNLDSIFIFNIIDNENLKKAVICYLLKQSFNLSNNFWEFNEIKDLRKINYPKTIKLDGNKNEIIYSFLPFEKRDDFQKYLEQSKIFEKYEKEDYHEINADNMNLFIIFLINKIILNLKSKKCENSEDYKIENNILEKCENIANNIFNNNKLFNENLNKLLLLYYNIDNYQNLIEEKLAKKNIKAFIPLLFGFPYCLKYYNNENSKAINNFYSSLMSKNSLSALKENYIPGNNNQQNYHLLSETQIKRHFKYYPSDKGCYVCSCGYYYSIDPCGFPRKNQSSDCPKCQKEIGYGNSDKLKKNHLFSINQREGHFRIFKDDDEKKIEMEKYKITDEMIPNKTLEQYKKEIIIPILNKEKHGIYLISKIIKFYSLLSFIFFKLLRIYF